MPFDVYYSVLWYESIIYTILGAIKEILILPLLLELFSNEPMIICVFSCFALSVSLILSSFSFPTGCYVSRSSRCLFSNCCRVIQTMAGARKQDRWYNNNHRAYPRHGKCRCTKILNSTTTSIKRVTYSLTCRKFIVLSKIYSVRSCREWQSGLR
jgi:hypothetical protein